MKAYEFMHEFTQPFQYEQYVTNGQFQNGVKLGWINYFPSSDGRTKAKERSLTYYVHIAGMTLFALFVFYDTVNLVVFKARSCLHTILVCFLCLTEYQFFVGYLMLNTSLWKNRGFI